MAETFLSDAWFDSVESIRDEQPEQPDNIKELQINITVTGGDMGDVDARLDGGAFERGHVEGAPTKLTVPYDVAKKLFIDQDQSAAMQAFMGGQIKVEGDMTKMMAMGQGGTPTPEQQAFSKKLQDLTA